jgi:hypothetical protein
MILPVGEHPHPALSLTTRERVKKREYDNDIQLS